MVIQGQQHNNITRKQQQRHRKKRPTTVQDEDKEILNKFIIVEDDDDESDSHELANADAEYLPNTDQDDLDEEEQKLEYNEEDDLDEDLNAAEQEEAEMVKADEREVQARGGNIGRQGAGAGGDVASTATGNKSSSANINNTNNNHDDGKEGETTHDKRSRAGHIGASAKVGYVDSDTAMTRAKFKIDGPENSSTSEGRSAVPPREPNSPTPSQNKKSGYVNPDYERGLKLWGKIYSTFFPSGFEREGSLSSEFYHLPVWQEVCEKAGLALPAAQLEAQGRQKPDYFKLAHENAETICEQCYKMTRPAGSFRALPVAVSGDDGPESSKTVRMCRDCRVEHYIDQPEPVPNDVAPYKAGDYTVTPRMTKGDAMKTYLLSASDVMSLPYEIGRNPYFGSNSPMYLFEEQYVLRLARQVHGGDIGIAANRSDSKYAGRKVPEPHDDAVKHRRNLLRSMLHDKGLHLPEHAAICHIYIATGLGDPLEIVNELEVVDWFHRCTSYDPSLDKAHIQQVKRRPRISRHRRTHPEGETLMSANAGGAAAQSIKEEVMSEEEEEGEDQHKMAALDDWLTHRLEQGHYQSYKQDPKGPERPPKAIWEMLDKIDMARKYIDFAAEKVYRVLEKKKHELRQEGALVKLVKSKGQIREIVDAPDQGFAQGRGGSGLSRRKRRRVDDEGDGDDGKEGAGKELKLSTVLEYEVVGSDWHSQVLQKAKELVKARLL